jgi:hypothetical protein
MPICAGHESLVRPTLVLDGNSQEWLFEFTTWEDLGEGSRLGASLERLAEFRGEASAESASKHVASAFNITTSDLTVEVPGADSNSEPILRPAARRPLR